MNNNQNVILLTGDPGVGKSTIAVNILEKLASGKKINVEDIFGYNTIRLSNLAGELEGFEIVTRGGERCLLASTNCETPHRYMKFFVNAKAFDKTLTSEFERAKKHPRPIIHIDEIGLMEKVSPGYINMLADFIRNFNAPMLAIIKYIQNDYFLDYIKAMDNVLLYTITKSNRRTVEREALKEFSAIIERSGNPS